MAENSKDASQGMQNNGWLGAAIGTVGGIVGGLNYREQENQIELERIRAERAKAENGQNTTMGIDKKYLYIAGGVIAFVVVLMMLKK